MWEEEEEGDNGGRDVNRKMHTCRGMREELEEMDAEFNRQIGVLFQTLKEVEEMTGKVYGLGKIELTLYMPVRVVNLENFCLHRTFASWSIHPLRHPPVLHRYRLSSWR